MGCANGAWRVFCTFFIVEEWIMRVILDTDKKTITVPWNYAAKLEEINRIIKDGGGAKQYTFKTYLEESWKACMDDTAKIDRIGAVLDRCPQRIHRAGGG